MSSLTTDALAIPFDLFQQTNEVHAAADVGMKSVTKDGRIFRLVYIGSLDIAQGLAVQAPPLVSAHQNLANVNSQAIGDTSITLTLGGTGLDLNQYQNGYIVVESGTGAGQLLQIRNNYVTAPSGPAVIYLNDPLVLALDSTSVISLIPNLYSNVVVNPTTETNVVLGATIYPTKAGNFAWVQTYGVASVLNDGGSAIGDILVSSNSVPGAFKTKFARDQRELAVAEGAILDTNYGKTFLLFE
jgi:hypothetical protein